MGLHYCDQWWCDERRTYERYHWCSRHPSHAIFQPGAPVLPKKKMISTHEQVADLIALFDRGILSKWDVRANLRKIGWL